MGHRDEIGIGLMGLGVVGGGVAQVLLNPSQTIPSKVGCPVRLTRVLVRDKDKYRHFPIPSELLTTDPEDILADSRLDVVVEVIGGEVPASDYIREALSRGKQVVTANKEVMAKQGPELVALAADKNVNLLFEASVGGGIPIVGPLMKDLLANEISSVHAIINGTTNYVLSRMARSGIDFGEALKEAQEHGYAEPDPSSDIEGTDAAYKLTVLATLAFHTRVHADDVFREGISRLEPQDFRYAQELGYAIKLLAIARRDGDSLQMRVHPCLVPQDHMLAKVDGAFNAIEIEGDLVGRVLLHGMGAGRDSTTSAVIGDVMEICRRLRSGSEPMPASLLNRCLRVVPTADLETKFYIRLNAADHPGVLAQAAKILGDLNISIASVIQKDTNYVTQTAELVVTTHPAREVAMQEAIKQIGRLEVIQEVKNLIRIEDWLPY